jgi:hypothetical protein
MGKLESEQVMKFPNLVSKAISEVKWHFLKAIQ